TWIMPCRGWANAEPRMRTSSGAYMRENAGMRTGPTRRSVLALIGSLAPAAALADYPDRPIKLGVALAPGRPGGTAARLFAPHFSERLGQSVVIENRTGASSVVGTESVVRAPPHPSRERAVQARGWHRYRPRSLSRRWTRGDGLAHRRRRHFHQ